jgi:hypothetical protein
MKTIYSSSFWLHPWFKEGLSYIVIIISHEDKDMKPDKEIENLYFLFPFEEMLS